MERAGELRKAQKPVEDTPCEHRAEAVERARIRTALSGQGFCRFERGVPRGLGQAKGGEEREGEIGLRQAGGEGRRLPAPTSRSALLEGRDHPLKVVDDILLDGLSVHADVADLQAKLEALHVLAQSP